MFKVFIGFDHREPGSFAVARHSILQNCESDIEIYGLVLDRLRKNGLYNREHVVKDGQMYDVISDAPMATEFAISRFLVPHLSGYDGFSLFMDSDMLVATDIHKILDVVNDQPGKAVYCVKHQHNPENLVKMDGQLQTLYKRKNWSSVMLFNNEHPANRKIIDLINTVPGRELHAFNWLQDDEIGELLPEWNYLVGHTVLPDDMEPKIIHWTEGSPEFPNYRDAPYADLWREVLRDWAECE